MPRYSQKHRQALGLEEPNRRKDLILWILVLAFYAGNVIFRFVALALIPLSIVAPTSALTIAFNAAFARYYFKETLTLMGWAGTLLVLGGCAVAVAVGPQHESSRSIQELIHQFSRGPFVIYSAITGAFFVLALVYAIHFHRVTVPAVMKAFGITTGHQVESLDGVHAGDGTTVKVNANDADGNPNNNTAGNAFANDAYVVDAEGAVIRDRSALLLTHSAAVGDNATANAAAGFKLGSGDPVAMHPEGTIDVVIIHNDANSENTTSLKSGDNKGDKSSLLLKDRRSSSSTAIGVSNSGSNSNNRTAVAIMGTASPPRPRAAAQAQSQSRSQTPILVPMASFGPGSALFSSTNNNNNNANAITSASGSIRRTNTGPGASPSPGMAPLAPRRDGAAARGTFAPPTLTHSTSATSTDTPATGTATAAAPVAAASGSLAPTRAVRSASFVDFVEDFALQLPPSADIMPLTATSGPRASKASPFLGPASHSFGSAGLSLVARASPALNSASGPSHSPSRSRTNSNASLNGSVKNNSAAARGSASGGAVVFSLNPSPSPKSVNRPSLNRDDVKTLRSSSASASNELVTSNSFPMLGSTTTVGIVTTGVAPLPIPVGGCPAGSASASVCDRDHGSEGDRVHGVRELETVLAYDNHHEHTFGEVNLDTSADTLTDTVDHSNEVSNLQAAVAAGFKRSDASNAINGISSNSVVLRDHNVDNTIDGHGDGKVGDDDAAKDEGETAAVGDHVSMLPAAFAVTQLSPTARMLLAFAMAYLPAITASWMNLTAKSAMALLKETINGNNYFIYFDTYLILIALIVSTVITLRFVSGMMKLFEAMLIVPIYQCLFIVGLILVSAFYFDDFGQLSTGKLIGFLISIAICFVGIFLLTQQSSTPPPATDAEADVAAAAAAEDIVGVKAADGDENMNNNTFNSGIDGDYYDEEDLERGIAYSPNNNEHVTSSASGVQMAILGKSQ